MPQPACLFPVFHRSSSQIAAPILFRDVIGRAGGNRHDGQSGFPAALRHKARAVGDKDILHVVDLVKGVQNAGFRIVPMRAVPHSWMFLPKMFSSSRGGVRSSSFRASMISPRYRAWPSPWPARFRRNWRECEARECPKRLSFRGRARRSCRIAAGTRLARKR